MDCTPPGSKAADFVTSPCCKPPSRPERTEMGDSALARKWHVLTRTSDTFLRINASICFLAWVDFKSPEMVVFDNSAPFYTKESATSSCYCNQKPPIFWKVLMVSTQSWLSASVSGKPSCWVEDWTNWCGTSEKVRLEQYVGRAGGERVQPGESCISRKGRF